MKRLLHFACVLLAAALVQDAHAEAPCSARLLIEPPRGYVGQQLVYRLQIERRAEVSKVRFSGELSFPSFRVEWLHGQNPDPAISGIGDHRVVAEERRALFPVRAGTLAIPPSRIVCTTPAGDFEAAVPGAEVIVDPLPAPAPGRLVGRVALIARLERDEITVGESVALHVQLHGEANLWDAPPMLAPDAIPGVEILAHEPRFERESGRRLLLTRTQTFDLVPRATGRIVLPQLRVPWLDPATRSWQMAEATPSVLLVTQAPVATKVEPPAARNGAGMDRRAIEWERFASVALGAAVGAWLARAALRRRRRGLAAVVAAEPHLEDAIAAHTRADHAAESHALAAALRAAIDARMPGAHALAAEEIAQRSDGPLRAAAEALADLDRARFASAAAALPDVERIRALIAAL